jgi:hypothetical protein
VNAATCVALSAVFPLVLLALGIERRNLKMKLRQLRVYRYSAFWGVCSGLIGTVLAVVGIQVDGYTWPLAIFIWVAFGVAVLTLGVTVVALMATHEIEEDAATE